jgi:hypothetical protein
MHQVNGGCHCGNIQVALELARPPAAYTPRACDCDFCRKHGAAYISDAQGSLAIRIRERVASGKYRQAGGNADFLVCKNCGVLVAVCYQSAARLYAAVNVSIIDDQNQFAARQCASPKMLSDAEKVRRWEELWFANVSM